MLLIRGFGLLCQFLTCSRSLNDTPMRSRMLECGCRPTRSRCHSVANQRVGIGCPGNPWSLPQCREEATLAQLLLVCRHLTSCRTRYLLSIRIRYHSFTLFFPTLYLLIVSCRSISDRASVPLNDFISFQLSYRSLGSALRPRF